MAIQLFFHLSVVSLNVFALWFDQTYVELPLPSKELADIPFKCRGLFLTIWCLVIQTAFFTAALLNDIFGTNAATPKRPPLIRKLKDTLFTIALPTALLVSLLFWTLYFTDKDLILPEHIERLIPKWLNHTLHTAIVPFIVFELFLCRINYPSRKIGVSVVYLMCALYSMLSFYTYFRTGLWVYPIINKFSWNVRIVWFLSNAILLHFLYLVGEKVNRIFNAHVMVQYTNGIKKN